MQLFRLGCIQSKMTCGKKKYPAIWGLFLETIHDTFVQLFFSCILLEALYSNLSTSLLCEACCQVFPCQSPNWNLEWLILGNVLKHPALHVAYSLESSASCNWEFLWSCGLSDIPVGGGHSCDLRPNRSPPVIVSGSNLFFQPRSRSILSFRPVM